MKNLKKDWICLIGLTPVSKQISERSSQMNVTEMWRPEIFFVRLNTIVIFFPTALINSLLPLSRSQSSQSKETANHLVCDKMEKNVRGKSKVVEYENLSVVLPRATQMNFKLRCDTRASQRSFSGSKFVFAKFW